MINFNLFSLMSAPALYLTLSDLWCNLLHFQWSTHCYLSWLQGHTTWKTYQQHCRTTPNFKVQKGISALYLRFHGRASHNRSSEQRSSENFCSSLMVVFVPPTQSCSRPFCSLSLNTIQPATQLQSATINGEGSIYTSLGHIYILVALGW